jgi:hypothetical protein
VTELTTEAGRALSSRLRNHGLDFEDSGLFSGDVVTGWLAHRRAVLALLDRALSTASES